eukprot:CAMPEP_0195508328 /NCGR_PEP_ID=MMETSP0794_2-20130614/1562_1 /TAXON_ID=515487 /ORGANISM="Stephanopyxis turris, Strain CCMP 815" /LENGTH=281 /DNA_ID=CAMNT_0040635255 /DNA_START=159 /DNA_END=1004 /DNA_ORIENTATION=+
MSMVDYDNISVYFFTFCTIGFFLYESLARASTKKKSDGRNEQDKQDMAKVVLKPTFGKFAGISAMLVCSVLLCILLLLFSERAELLGRFVTLEVESYSNIITRKHGEEPDIRENIPLYLFATAVFWVGYRYGFSRKCMKDDSGSLADRLVKNEDQDSVAELPDKPTKNNWKSLRRNSQIPQHFSSAKGQNNLGSDGVAYENAREKYYKNQVNYSDRAMGKAAHPRSTANAFDMTRQSCDENESPTKPNRQKIPSRTYMGGPSAAAYEAKKSLFYGLKDDIR